MSITTPPFHLKRKKTVSNSFIRIYIIKMVILVIRGRIYMQFKKYTFYHNFKKEVWTIFSSLIFFESSNHIKHCKNTFFGKCFKNYLGAKLIAEPKTNSNYNFSEWIQSSSQVILEIFFQNMYSCMLDILALSIKVYQTAF